MSWIATIEEWGVFLIAAIAIGIPIAHARLLSWRGPNRSSLDRLDRDEQWVLLVSRTDFRRLVADGDARSLTLPRRFIGDMRSISSGALVSSAAVFVGLGVWAGSTTLLGIAGITVSLYGWMLVSSHRRMLAARVNTIHVERLTAPTFGDSASANPSSGSGSGYGVRWSCCAALMQRGPVELMVLEIAGEPAGEAIAMRPTGAEAS
ncbi:MAG: hypothetical protein K0V04_02170 [Deltaproteobacteria bacterium]|nr:hypothetical protein [Deltaproteobacteria bacterium]